MDYEFLKMVMKLCFKAFARYEVKLKDGSLELIIIGSKEGFAKRILFSESARVKKDFLNALKVFLKKNEYID